MVALIVRRSVKEPKGKLVNIVLEVSDDSCIVTDAVITGDFFAYPPEPLDDFRSLLRGENLRDIKALVSAVEELLKNVVIVGVDKERLIRELASALKEARERCTTKSE